MEKTLVAILSPKKEKGIATLRIGTEMWNYFPRINKVMKVPPSMMMGAWMGSDFTNDDVVKESSLTRDYSCAFEDSGRDDVYRIALAPREDTPTVWGKIVFTVRRKDLIPLEEVFYDEDGEPIRTMAFRDEKMLGGRFLPAVLEMVPLNKKGHKTVIRYLDARFDADLEADVFTLRRLRSRR
jgi:outer membrane lipoprotein-sorting protein